MKKIKAETVSLRERRRRHNCFQNEEVSWVKRRERRNQNKGKKIEAETASFQNESKQKE